jgi:uncharacterized protein (TIGR03083 family)
MSERGVEALRADRDEVLAVARSLNAEEWATPSDCAGWRVQDVVTHMGAVCQQVVEPGSMPAVAGDVEATQDQAVALRKDWTPEQVLEDYEQRSAAVLEALAGLQAPGIADSPITLDNLGTHPLHLLANALAFDHFCHLRNDILRPNGPIDRPAPPADDLRLEATMEWLLSGLPQMAAEPLRAAVSKPLALRLGGPGGGEWTLRPAEGDGLVTLEEGADPGAAATVSSTAEDFVVWGTQRRSWRERAVEVEGDEAYAASVLDAIHVF